jgi:hypothetical protein
MATTGSELLDLLDNVVRDDAGTPGFSGILAFGVRDGEQTLWWQVSCGDRARAAFVDAPSSECDAVLVMGRREAEAITTTGHIPAQPELLLARGERALLSRFVRRYVQPQSSVAVRCL